MENGRIGPPRPPALLCASPGLCQRDGVRHAHLLYLLCQGSTSVRLNCPKKGYTLNPRPVIPLGWSKGSQVQALPLGLGAVLDKFGLQLSWHRVGI